MNSNVLFFGFTNAFDTISYARLDSCRIRGHCLDWFKKYLESRNYVVKIDDELSKTREVIYGIPQGSKLDQILFILYTNEINNIFTNTTSFT